MRILDLYCCAGGAAVGLKQAFPDAEIVGVDINPQPNYPFSFVQGDVFEPFGALDYLASHAERFAFVWASPPCQAHTTMSNRWRGTGSLADQRVDLIAMTRTRLVDVGVPYIIENVVGARSKLIDPVQLHGGMFGLGVYRPRLFEASFPIRVPVADPPVNPIGVYGKAADGRLLWRRKDGTEQRAARSVAEAGAAMGINWMEWRELAEAIPPAYSRYLAQFIPTVGAQCLPLAA